MKAIHLDKTYDLRWYAAVLMAALSCNLFAEQICHRDNIRASTPDSRYHIESVDVVIDDETGLMWRKCVEGLQGDRCEGGTSLNYHWAEALLHVKALNESGGAAGFKDWRLPNVRELNTLVDIQCISPSINSNVFPNSPSAHLWTSSPDQALTFYSWYVDFERGETSTDDRKNKKFLRLVRDR